MAIKFPIGKSIEAVNCLLKESKVMLEINAYHDNIVNLQGITYQTVRRLAEHIVEESAAETIEVGQLLQVKILK